MTSGRPDLPARTVVGAEALAVLAVPARWAILSHLLDVGPRTASECAELVGESPSNCSWHLRVLARVGLVERVEEEHGDGRRRPWRATGVGLELGGDGSPAGRVAETAMAGVLADHADELFRRHLARQELEPPEWRSASGASAYSLAVTAEEFQALVQAIDDLVRPYVRTVRTDAPAGSRVAALSLRAFPHPDAPGPATADEP